jgi:hypothetical protein
MRLKGRQKRGDHMHLGKKVLATALLVLAIALVLPVGAFADAPSVTREHVRGADGVWMQWDASTNLNTDADIQVGVSRMTSKTGPEKTPSEYLGNYVGLLFHWQQVSNDWPQSYYREIYGSAPDAILVMDNKLTAASVTAPVVVTENVWENGQMWDEEFNLLPPTSTRTYTVFVTAKWVAGDEPLSSGHNRIWDSQTGYRYMAQSSGSARDVAPVANVIGADGEVLMDGPATWGGMFDYHDFSMDKYSDKTTP